MVETAEVFQHYGSQYRDKYGERMLPSHWKVMRDAERMALGGHVYTCETCEGTVYHYSPNGG